jgi:AhpD family alkylhydroperoxidase
MNETRAVRYAQEIGDELQAMGAAQRALWVAERGALDPVIRHLVHIRASQINGCNHCLDMHLKEARDDGETQERLDRIVVWPHASQFTEREKAALAWTEALTALDGATDLGPIRARLRASYSDREIGLLTVEVGLINFWNRVNVANH